MARYLTGMILEWFENLRYSDVKDLRSAQLLYGPVLVLARVTPGPSPVFRQQQQSPPLC